MSIAVFTAFISLFAIPWTVVGLIHPAAAGMRGASRWRVLGLGVFALVALLAIATALSEPLTTAVQTADGNEASDAVFAMTALWLLSCLVWPLAAMVLRIKERARAVTKEPAEKAEPTAATEPMEDGKLEQPSAEQHRALDLEECAEEPIEPPADEAPARRASVDNPFAHLHPESVAPRTVSFLYENSQGDLSDREVTVDQVGSSHFAGFCHREGDERTFRFDRILGLATLTDTGEKILPYLLRDLLRGYDEHELRRRKRAAAKAGNEILFTGFKKDRRAELEEIARAAGMAVRTRVTENLDILCIGSNAGPSKIEEAIERGLIVLDEHQLLQMLETGEVQA